MDQIRGPIYKERILWHDILRILVILYVFFFHYNMHFKPTWNSTLSALLSFGGGGMVLLFMLSGCALYLSSRQLQLDQPAQIIAFYKKRIMRIMPPYLIYLAISIWGFLLRGGNKQLALLLPIELLGAQSLFSCLWDYWGNSGTWFVSTILILYFLFPLLKVLVEQIKHPWLALLVCYVIGSYPAIIETHFGGTGYYIHPCFRAAEFTIGIIVGRLILSKFGSHSNVNAASVKAKKIFMAILLASATIVMGIILLRLRPALGEEYYRYNFLLIPYFLLVIIGGLRLSIGKKAEKTIIFLSKTTYPFYIAQPIANTITKEYFLIHYEINITLPLLDFAVNFVLAVLIYLVVNYIDRFPKMRNLVEKTK